MDKLNDGDTLTSPCGEIINVRVYRDGYVKLESMNMKTEFQSESDALIWINANGITLKQNTPV